MSPRLLVAGAVAVAVAVMHPGIMHAPRRLPACPAAVCHPSAFTGSAVVDDARRYLGVPYVWGGADRSGMDCSGLVLRVYADLGTQLPHSSAEQARLGAPVRGGLRAARPGDLLFWGSPVHHVAIYVGGGRLIEAPDVGQRVSERAVYGQLAAIRRIPVRR